jgi:hypothetical protein
MDGRHDLVALRARPHRNPRPAHDRGVIPTAQPLPAARENEGTSGQTVRVLVVGSIAWPRNRAVEVRDAIAAVVCGHRRVLLVHAGRICPDTGCLVGVDAWAELTATRLGLQTLHVGEHRDRQDPSHTRPSLTPAPTSSSPSP